MYGYKKQKKKKYPQDNGFVFEKTCKPKERVRLLDSVKNVDLKSLPPFQGILVEKIKRHCWTQYYSKQLECIIQLKTTLKLNLDGN